MLLHSLAHFGNAFLVQDFVALNVNTPITRALLEGAIRVPPQNGITHSLVVVPIRLNDADF